MIRINKVSVDKVVVLESDGNRCESGEERVICITWANA